MKWLKLVLVDLQQMIVTLDIPDDVMAVLPVPAAERNHYVMLEIACSFYARGLLSLGRAAELASMAKLDFGHEVSARGIPRHYGETELAADIKYAGTAALMPDSSSASCSQRQVSELF